MSTVFLELLHHFQRNMLEKIKMLRIHFLIRFSQRKSFLRSKNSWRTTLLWRNKKVSKSNKMEKQEQFKVLRNWRIVKKVFNSKVHRKKKHTNSTKKQRQCKVLGLMNSKIKSNNKSKKKKKKKMLKKRKSQMLQNLRSIQTMKLKRKEKTVKDKISSLKVFYLKRFKIKFQKDRNQNRKLRFL